MSIALFALSVLVRSGGGTTDLTIDNFQPGDLVRYPVVIVRGAAEGPEMAIGTTWKSAIRFPVVGHRYAAVVELKPGINMLVAHSGSETMKFRLDYRPMTTPYKVLSVFVSALDEPPTYYVDNGRERFLVREKLDVAMKLLQAFTADAMSRAGYGRKTFALEFDKEGHVEVHYVKSPKPGDELRAMEGGAIWSHVYDILKAQFPEATTKWCGLMGFTRFDPIAKKAQGHLSLGGGSEALFGGGSMQWWPNNLKEVPKAFKDTTFIDPSKTFEDSNSRRTVWANLSTAYGAMLHELGHTFGLPHSPDPFCVMSRGFDYFSRAFTVVEAPGAGEKDPKPFSTDQLTRWGPFFAARLNYSPWFQPDGNKGAPFDTSTPPKITVNGDAVTIDAPNGVRVVGAENDGIQPWFNEYRDGDAPKQLKLSRADLRAKMQNTTQTFTIVAVDSQGNIAEIQDKPTG